MRRILLAVIASVPLLAAASGTPEIKRQSAAPQAVGQWHSLRTIPEACLRLQGRFTGEVARPYALEVVTTNPACRPRARFLPYAETTPETARGWIFNDEIRVPAAACPRQQAVLRVWRHPGNVAPPKLDAQGRSRVYLQDARRTAATADLPRFTAHLAIEGEPCS